MGIKVRESQKSWSVFSLHDTGEQGTFLRVTVITVLYN